MATRHGAGADDHGLYRGLPLGPQGGAGGGPRVAAVEDVAALEVSSVTLGPGDFPRRRLARPRTAGIVGQLPRGRGRTGLPRAGATSSVHRPRRARLPRRHTAVGLITESPQIGVGRGGASSMPPQHRNSIEMSAPWE